MTDTKVTAKIETKGDAFVLTAGFKYDTIHNLVKYGKGDALKLIEKENKDEKFRVSADKIASFSAHGVAFTGANADGYAEATGCFPRTSMSKKEKEEYLVENFALIIASLNEVQTQVESAAKDLDKVMGVVKGSINIG